MAIHRQSKLKHMDTKEIFQNITKGVILSIGVPVAINDEREPMHLISIYASDGCHVADKRIVSKKLKHAEANCKAMVLSFNETIGKGINPESVEKMRNLLQDLLDLVTTPDIWKKEIKEALTAATLQ